MPAPAAEVIRAVRGAASLPVIAKLTPNTGQLVHVAHACVDAGADALSLINTLVGMWIDVKSRRPLLGRKTGGLSGPAVKPVALARVYETYAEVGHRVPIIGMGGISNADDAFEFVLAGATAVGVGTALFYNHRAPREITAGLAAHVEAAGVPRLSDAVGLAHREKPVAETDEHA
jgi:dihydroorotate dehydrogenase (NAD+) catalytic subunit